MRFLLLLLPLSLAATEFAPWFSPLIEPDLQVAWETQYYPDVDSGSPNPKPCIHHSNTLNSLWGSLMISPWFDLNAELELQTTHSAFSKHTFFDYGKLTVRYRFLDDVAGDPISLTTGLSVTVPSHRSLREIGTPHLGHTDVELHAAIGKEVYYCPDRWAWRFWAMGAIAASRWGPPRLRGQAFVERNLKDRYFLHLGGELLINFGGKDLMCPCVFDGYAPIQTRAGDIRCRFAYRIPCCMDLWVEYRYRYWAHNCPERDSIVRIGIFYPLSI